MRTIIVTMFVVFVMFVLVSVATGEIPLNFEEDVATPEVVGSDYITREDLEELPARVGALERRPDRVGISSSIARRIATSVASEKAETARVDARKHADKVAGEAMRKANEEAGKLADAASLTAITFSDDAIAKEAGARKKGDRIGLVIAGVALLLAAAAFANALRSRSSRSASVRPGAEGAVRRPSPPSDPVPSQDIELEPSSPPPPPDPDDE